MAKMMDINEIKKILPHRYPFLLVDRVLDYIPAADGESMVGSQIKCIKNVTVNEPFFQGHFPHRPIMPGVLQIEAMAQTAALICSYSEVNSKEILIAGVNEARFRKQVIPGDVLVFESEIIKFRRKIAIIKCKAFVDGQLASEATIMAALETNGA